MKKNLIIEASSGIGKTLSQALAEGHYDVFGTYFKTEVNSTDIHFRTSM